LDLEPLARSVTSRGEPFKAVECENPRRKIAVDVAKEDAARFSLAAASATSARAAKDDASAEPVNSADQSAGVLHGRFGSFRRAHGGAVATTATAPTAQPAVVLKAALVALKRSWQALDEAVQSMQLVLDDERSCLITAALDGVVRVFDLAGTLLGTLMQGESVAGKGWRVKTDIRARRARSAGRPRTCSPTLLGRFKTRRMGPRSPRTQPVAREPGGPTAYWSSM
jgi:hypothetical protein